MSCFAAVYCAVQICMLCDIMPCSKRLSALYCETGQAFDEINLKRWSMSGNTKCPVSGQELRMHKDKVQYTKHHLLRNIIRQQAAKAKVCLAVPHAVQ